MLSRSESLNPEPSRLEHDLAEPARIRDPESGGRTTTVFSEPYRASREWIRSRMLDFQIVIRYMGQTLEPNCGGAMP